MQHLATEATGTSLEAMLTAGLSEDEILRLFRLRRDIDSGRRSEITLEHKRLTFARYLYEHGLMHDLPIRQARRSLKTPADDDIINGHCRDPAAQRRYWGGRNATARTLR